MLAYIFTFLSNFLRLSNRLKVIASSTNQADSSFATDIRDENLDRVMKTMYNETLWTIDKNQGYAFADAVGCSNIFKLNE